MRLRLVFVVVALLCLSPALWAQEQPSCKLANEQYLECGSACPATCANPAPEMCVDMCVAGCFCATGFLRAADGSCVEASTCTTATANGCPPGVEKASCLVDPCFAAKCASSPGAKCTPNYCGGCNAVFTDAASGQVVDCDAAVPDPAVDPNTGCPPGVPTARCFADPCAVNQCPAFPTARCTANYCGGCHAVFTDAVSGQKVDCNAQTTPASDCTYDGKTYKAGESWRPSPCSTCSCDGQTGTSQCAVMDCAPPRCDTPVTKPGQCCPVCEDAAPVCGANEVYFQCAPNCPLRCGEPPAAVCTEQCTPGCGCKPGFLLTKDGRCVEGKDCPGAPPQRVDEHGCVPSAGFAWCQSKSKCLRAWEEDCADVSILPVDEVDANGCLLGAGYVWCEAKTKCIRPWEEKCAPAPFGGSADQHGCVGSAGYQWCEAKQRCHRPWEEDCAPPSIGLGGGGEGCKTHAGYLWCEAKQKCLRPWEEPCSTGAHVLHRRDPQGCVVTAGYLWCEAKQRCVRAWEERCEASANANANASATQPSSQPALRPLLGAVVSTLANRHECLGHAGYTWCDAKQKCLRLWEEPCEQRTGGTTGSGSGSGCLGSAGYVWCESSAKCLRTWEERCDALLGVVTDGNGCQPSTGMMWCEAKRKCLRPWEEPCEERITPGGGPHLLGGADGKDPNGCIGHAGYIYCASKQKCLRPWEEECPTATTFGGRDENGCAGTAGFTWCQHKGKCVRPWEEECEASAPLHNCHSREVWSQDKQDWCCKNKNIGCSDECSACTGPAPLGASKLCTDGSVAGPVCKRSATGKCGWEMTVCPVIEGPQVCCLAMPACPMGYAAIDSCDATDAQCRNVTMCCTTIFCKAIELPIGGNQDPTNPCAAMGGYTWCAAKSKCLRVWEEACDTPHAVDASTGITSATTSLAGGKRDANGCLASSGHTWCASKGKCLRVWEEDCPLSSCSAATDGTRCDDGDDATVNDHCVAGKCFGRPVRRVGPSIRTVLQMELDQFDANDWLAKLTAHFKLPSADYINIVSVRGGSVTVEHQFVVPADADAAAAAATAEPSTLTTQYLSEATDPSSALSASTLVKSAAPADEELPANVTPGIGYHSGVPAFVGAGGGIFVGVALLAVGVVIARKRLQARKTVSEMANAEALL